MQCLGGALRKASFAHRREFHRFPINCVRLSSGGPSGETVTTQGSLDTTLQGHADPVVQQRAVGETDEQEIHLYKQDVRRVRGVYAPRFIKEREQKREEKAAIKAAATKILEKALSVPLVPRNMEEYRERALEMEKVDLEAEAALSPEEREKLVYWRKIKKMRRLTVEAKEAKVKEERIIDRETAVKRKEEWARRSYKLVRQAELHSSFWQTDMTQLIASPSFWNNDAATHTDEEFFGKETGVGDLSEQDHMQDTHNIMDSIRSQRPKYYMDTDDLDLYSLVGQNDESGTGGSNVSGKHEGNVFGDATGYHDLQGAERLDNSELKEEISKIAEEMETKGFNPANLTMLKDKSLSLEDVDGEFFATYFMDFDKMAESAGLDAIDTNNKEDVQQMVKEFNRSRSSL